MLERKLKKKVKISKDWRKSTHFYTANQTNVVKHETYSSKIIIVIFWIHNVFEVKTTVLLL